MANELLFLDGARVFLSLSVFAYASWSDCKKREVSNKVWLIMAPLAFALTTFQYVVFSPSMLQFYALSFAITAGLSIALFYLGAFGGADAKALMCLALALPSYPDSLLQSNAPLVSPIFPVTVFSNGVLLAAFTVVYAVLRNSFWRLRTGRKLFEGFENESSWRKVLAFLTGYKVKAVALEKGHMYPLEDVRMKETGESEKKLLIFPNDEKAEGTVERILNATREGRLPSEVWATPGLPLLIFITAGFVIALMFGDLVWILLSLILK
jgi:preflagellin peptidase FlaK